MSAYNYERFDAYAESAEDEREVAAFQNAFHAGERAPDSELTLRGGGTSHLSGLRRRGA